MCNVLCWLHRTFSQILFSVNERILHCHLKRPNVICSFCEIERCTASDKLDYEKDHKVLYLRVQLEAENRYL